MRPATPEDILLFLFEEGVVDIWVTSGGKLIIEPLGDRVGVELSRKELDWLIQELTKIRDELSAMEKPDNAKNKAAPSDDHGTTGAESASGHETTQP